MEPRTLERISEGAPPAPGRAQHLEESPDFWYFAQALYRRWKLIAAITIVVAVLSVVIALLMPNWYRAEARLLEPTGGGGMSSLIQSLAPEAAALLGETSGNYTRYLAILTSRTVLERVVEAFDLEEVYEVADTPFPRTAALKALRKNTTFEIDLEYDYLSVAVLDQDPERAAEIVGFLVAQLNEENIALSTQSARENRLFLERRVGQAEADLDSVKSQLQAFQEEYGLLALDVQSEVFLTSLGSFQERVAELEIQADALEAQYGRANPQTAAAREALNAARARLRSVLNGSEELMPVAFRDLPELGRTYADLQQELLIQGEIMRVLRPLYENARLDEQREQSAVQVLDPAVAPERKAKPKRAVLCIVATLSGFLIVSSYVLLIAWLRYFWPGIARRLKTA